MEVFDSQVENLEEHMADKKRRILKIHKEPLTKKIDREEKLGAKDIEKKQVRNGTRLYKRD